MHDTATREPARPWREAGGATGGVPIPGGESACWPALSPADQCLSRARRERPRPPDWLDTWNPAPEPRHFPHPASPGHALPGLDDSLRRALGTVISARLTAGAAVGPLLKSVPEESGGLARFEAAAGKIPDRLPISYPPAGRTARELPELADALDIFYPAHRSNETA